MSTITQKSFFALLLLASSLFSWANTSSVNDDRIPKKSSTIAVPAPPKIISAEPESCGYQFANDPTSFVKLLASGCDGRNPKWYDSNGTMLAEGKNPFFMPITSDKTVYVTCSDGDGESLPSAPVLAKYVKAVPTVPTITANGDSKYTVKCFGEPVKLQASETNSSYFYRWLKSPGTTAINHTVVQQGQGASSFTTYENGNYSLEVYALECPNVTRYSAPVYVNILENPSKPKITGDSTFCGDKSTNLSASSTRSGSSNFTYNWFINGIKQDTVKTNSIKNVKVSASTQVQAVYVQEGQTCISSLSDVYKVRALEASPKPIITASKKGAAICQGDTLTLRSTTASAYKWNTGATTASIAGIKAVGKYAVQTYSKDGCISPTSDTVTITVYTRPVTPTITSSKVNATICQGDTLSLTSSAGLKYLWSDGSSNRIIAGINKVATYTVQTIDINGCVSDKSAATTIKVNALPAKPVVTASGATSFCDGFSVTLTSSPELSYSWSNLSTTKSIDVTKSGVFSLTVKDVNGCVSPKSDAVTVTVYALPAKPTVTVKGDGKTTFCADRTATLEASDLTNGELTKFKWSTTEVSKAITAKTSDKYSVVVIDPRGCVSPTSDVVTITVLPLPAAPTVTFDGADFGGKSIAIFCTRDNVDYSKLNSVNMIATSNFEVTWSDGTVGKVLSAVKKSGDYTAVATQKYTDGNACTSLKSAILTVLVKENPDVVASGATITKDGTFILKAVNFPDGGNYEWKYGGTVVTDVNNATVTTASVKVSKYGDYIARRQIIYTVPAPTNQLVCYSNYVAPFTFKEDPDFRGLSIYPNPGNGAFTVEALDNLKNVEISIYDLFGRIIWSKTFASLTTKTPVDLTAQPIGTYLLRCKADGFDVTKRIITNR
ncbi:MAG: T9SS type A sorting domain-containing protein [Flectobacillus sp.]|nr:T9SS type A sorting domain-containing protein [Flectobacillus sp.]